MVSETSENDPIRRQEAIRKERANLAVEIARLTELDEQLAREDERLTCWAKASATEPYAVNAQWLTAKLGMSVSGFYGLVNNRAKGFPNPVFVDSDRRWIWPEIQAWLETTRRTGAPGRRAA